MSKNNSKYKKLISDTIIFALGNLGSKIILFFMVPLYTNFLTTEEYGTSDFVFTIAQLIVPFVSLVIFDAVLRFGLAKNIKKENVLKTSLLIILVGAAFTIAITPVLGLYHPLSEWKWYLCVYVILNMYNNVLLNYLKIIELNKAYAAISIISTLILALSNIMLLIYMRSGIRGYLISTLLASATTAVFASFSIKLRTSLRKGIVDKGLLLKMVKYSVPLILNNISWWIIQSSDKIMIETMVGMAALGLYTAATKIPSLINVVISIFSQAWGVSSIKEYESSNDNKFYSDVFVAYSSIAFGMVIIINTIIQPFMSIYVSEEFQEAWRFVPLLLVSAAFSAVASYYGSLYGALKKSTHNMRSTLCAAIINIVINYFGILTYGIWGAIIGTVVSYFVLALYRMTDVLRYININPKWLSFFANIVIITIQAILVSSDCYPCISSIIGILLFITVNRDTIHNILIHTRKTIKKG